MAGRVRVNGQVVRELGAAADPRRDRVEVDGKRLRLQDLAYVVLHKPRNVVSTLRDPQGRPTVAELVKAAPVRLFPVGRLDYGTSGVLLMTNDGEFADGLLRPRKHVPKTYVVKLAGRLTDEQLAQWRTGVALDDGPTLPAEVRLLREGGDVTWLELTLREGRNRQIRRMAEASGVRVMRLARTGFAGIECTDLRPGRWRALTVDELRRIRKQYGVPSRVRAQPALGTAGAGSSSRGPRGGTPSGPRLRPKRPPGKAAGGARVGRNGRSGTKPRATGRRGARAPGRGRR